MRRIGLLVLAFMLASAVGCSTRYVECHKEPEYSLCKRP